MCIARSKSVMAVVEPKASYAEDYRDLESSLDNAAAAEVLRKHTVMITDNVNLPALKPYLFQNKCITFADVKKFHPESPQSESAFRLIEILSKRGVSAFIGFLKALKGYTTKEPGEAAHSELLDALKTEAMRYRRRPSGASIKSQISKTSCSLQNPTSDKTFSIPEESVLIITGEDDKTERDLLQPTREDGGQDVETVTQVRSDHEEEEMDIGDPMHTTATVTLTSLSPPVLVEGSTSDKILNIWLLWFASVVMCICSPVFFVGGIVILVLSVLGFKDSLDCDGVGSSHSLSVFNFFFGLLCLSVPGLLTMLILYFCCEDRNTRWEKKFRITKCLVWMTISVFLSIFVLTVFELLYSLVYVAPEVYGHFTDWNEIQTPSNGTLCDKEIYFTSFSILTFSYGVVFLLLVILGFFIAGLYFRWITDQENPGTLSSLIHACLRKGSYNTEPSHVV